MGALELAQQIHAPRDLLHRSSVIRHKLLVVCGVDSTSSEWQGWRRAAGPKLLEAPILSTEV